MLKRLSKNAKITLSILLILIGLYLSSYNYYDGVKHLVFNYHNIKLLEEEILIEEELDEILEEENPIIEIPEEIIETPYKEEVKDKYIGYLSVPDVSIKRGFYNIESKYNKVSKNVTVIPTSTMPDVDKGNLILAAHRGNSSVSYFDKLYQLNIGAYAYVNYNNKEYKYKLKRVYIEPKDGILTIRRNPDVSSLTLITCTKDDKLTQTIFSFELESVV